MTKPSLTISADHIPSDAKIIRGAFGRVAIYPVRTDAVLYPIRHNAALLRSDGRIIQEVSGGCNEHGALQSLYETQGRRDGGLQAAKDLGLNEANIAGVLTQISKGGR